MGRHRDKNFHKDMIIRRGFGDAAQRIQDFFLAKRKDEAVAAVPGEFCNEMSLVARPRASVSAIAREGTPPSRADDRHRANGRDGTDSRARSGVRMSVPNVVTLD